MSSVTQIKGVTFVSIVEKWGARSGNGYRYLLSNGAEIHTTSTFHKGEWYFMNLTHNLVGKYWQFHSATPVTLTQAKEFDTKLKNLQQLADKLAMRWTVMSNTERDLFLSRASTVLSGLGSASFGIDFIAGIIAEGVAGVATGGLSLVVSGVLGLVSYSSREKTKALVSRFGTALAEYQDAREEFSYFLKEVLPSEYDNLEFIDPQFQALVTRLRYIFKNVSQTEAIKGFTKQSRIVMNKVSSWVPQRVMNVNYGVA
jgi:hypothetical protein